MLRLQFSGHPDRGHWDQTLVDDLFEDIDDNIVLIPAKDQATYVPQINQRLSELPYCVVLIMSDEESSFPLELLEHSKMILWLQYPADHQIADRYVPGGYSPDTTSIRPALKTLDWFFSGQITRPNRYEVAEALRTLSGGLLIETEGFTQGLEHKDYLEVMARSQIVPCPSGAATPDTIRLWEALELGCMPVIHERDRQFYQKILGDFPFPSVSNWTDIIHLEVVDCTVWWESYKQQLVNNMQEDLQWLRES